DLGAPLAVVTLANPVAAAAIGLSLLGERQPGCAGLVTLRPLRSRSCGAFGPGWPPLRSSHLVALRATRPGPLRGPANGPAARATRGGVPGAPAWPSRPAGKVMAPQA
ncbi:hypothetical protein ABZ173_38210, partial [Streptomyces rochei]